MRPAGINGSAPGYHVNYGPVVTQGQGQPLSLRGGASLNILLQAPAYNMSGTPTYNPADPANAVNVNGFRTFRQVAYGGSFEGYTTVGLGVRARLPFRVFPLSDPGHHSRVVIAPASAGVSIDFWPRKSLIPVAGAPARC